MKLRDLLLLAGSVAAGSQVCALTLGATTKTTVELGSPLDLIIQVQPDVGSTVQTSCLKAQIWMGDTLLPSGQVQLLPQDKGLRIRTATAVYEPLVKLQLSAGCAGSVTRSYTFFADPPGTLAASVRPIDLHKIQLPALAISSLSQPIVGAPASRLAKRAVNPQAIQEIVRETAAETVPVLSSTFQPVTKPESSSEAGTPASAEHKDTRPTTEANIEPTLPTSDEATDLALNASDKRLEVLEQQLLYLQSQLTEQRTHIRSLENQLLLSAHWPVPGWVYALIALCTAALAATVALLLYVRKQRDSHQTPLTADEPDLFDHEDLNRGSEPALPVIPPMLAPAQQPAEAISTSQTQPTSTSTAAAKTSTDEELTPDQLIMPIASAPLENLSAYAATTSNATATRVDLAHILTSQAMFSVREQADFFASIGENDQAIAILETHIAENQASSPLAYIELLHLLYRLGRTDAFEHVREQFQNHFNVRVPGFLGFSRKGHDLWSAHPDVLAKIESIWPTDAVESLLRSLILRHTDAEHAQAQNQFDLAALDDLLVLYDLAQNTDAANRGVTNGRQRTTPLEAPLPVMDLKPTKESPQGPGFLAQPYASSPLNNDEHATLNLSATDLELLNAAPAQKPLAPSVPTNDSPFQRLSHFAPDEVLMEGLSLDWSEASPKSLSSETATPDAPPLKLLEAEFNTAMPPAHHNEAPPPHKQN